MLGMPMFGERLDAHMLESEQHRWHTVVKQMEPGRPQGPAVLLPTTLEHRTGAPVDVELFIVDRRKVSPLKCSCSQSETDSQCLHAETLGFLIGLRLVQLVPLPLPSPQQTSVILAMPPTGDSEGAAPEQPARAGTCDSIPSTMVSAQLPQPEISDCSRQELEEDILGMTWPGLSFTSAQTTTTLLASIRLLCDSARGGALLCIAEKAAFDKVFGDAGEMQDQAKPCLRTSDAGYMTNQLKGVHITDDRFAAAFADFTEHSESDRWPKDHPDPEARNQPKDGAFLISVSGYCLKSAVKILGLPPPRSWASVGTKHEAALACAWAVEGCCVLVRSDGGALHVIFRDGHSLQVKQLDPGA